MFPAAHGAPQTTYAHLATLATFSTATITLVESAATHVPLAHLMVVACPVNILTLLLQMMVNATLAMLLTAQLVLLELLAPALLV